MLTNNAKSAFSWSPESDSFIVTTIRGSSVSSRSLQAYSLCNWIALTPQGQGQSVCVGSGGGVETPESYNLEQIIDSGITTSWTYQKNDYKITFSKLVSNVSDQDIIIREIGFFRGYGSTSDIAMFDRTVLKEPVVIKPNESKSITYTIDYSNI